MFSDSSKNTQLYFSRQTKGNRLYDQPRNIGNHVPKPIHLSKMSKIRQCTLRSRDVPFVNCGSMSINLAMGLPGIVLNLNPGRNRATGLGCLPLLGY